MLQVAPGERFLIVASCTAPVHPSAQNPGAAAVHGLPLVASTTLHVVRLHCQRNLTTAYIVV